MIVPFSLMVFIRQLHHIRAVSYSIVGSSTNDWAPVAGVIIVRHSSIGGEHSAQVQGGASDLGVGG